MADALITPAPTLARRQTLSLDDPQVVGWTPFGTGCEFDSPPCTKLRPRALLSYVQMNGPIPLANHGLVPCQRHPLYLWTRVHLFPNMASGHHHAGLRELLSHGSGRVQLRHVLSQQLHYLQQRPPPDMVRSPSPQRVARRAMASPRNNRLTWRQQSGLFLCPGKLGGVGVRHGPRALRGVQHGARLCSGPKPAQQGRQPR